MNMDQAQEFRTIILKTCTSLDEHSLVIVDSKDKWNESGSTELHMLTADIKANVAICTQSLIREKKLNTKTSGPMTIIY